MANGIVLNLDTTKSEFQNPMIELRQGDGNYQSLDVTVTSNGEPFDLTGWTTTFMGTTAGGFKIVDAAVSNVDATNGKFTYTPTKAWGQNQGEFKNAYFSFVKSDKTASSAAFRVNVLDAVDITAEEAGDYISIVDQTIDKLTIDLSGLVTNVNDLKSQNLGIKTSNNTWTGTNTFNNPIVGSVTGSATKLQTPRNINGTPFDGTSDITITGSGALAVGGIYPTLADLASANPNHDRTYITTDNGNWNYWNGTTWVAGGVYQSAGIANDSVTSEMLSGNARDISIYVNNISSVGVFNIDSINMTLTSSNGYANFGRHSDLIPTTTLNLEFSINIIYYDFTLKVLGVTDQIFKLTNDQALIGIIQPDLSVVDLKVTNYSIDGVDVKTGKINTYIYSNNISIDTVNKSLVITGAAYINHGTNSELIPYTNLSLSNNINVIYYDFANKILGVTDNVSKVNNQREFIGIITSDLSVIDLKVTNYSIDGVNVKTSVRDKFINHNVHAFGDAVIDLDKKTLYINSVWINYDYGAGKSVKNVELDVSNDAIVYFDTKDGAIKATDQYKRLKDGQLLLGNFQAGLIQGSFFNSFSRILVVKNGITYDAAGYKARNALLLNTYMATFGDSITSDQVSGTGTQIMNALGAKKTGNFATGWSTGSDWHDGTTNTTTVTLTTPNNTDTNDNVLSNQVRRALQYTTASGHQITWTHPIDGVFSLDTELGTGLGNTDKIPSVIYIAISTNDGKNASVPIVDDTDAVLAQNYKDLTRNSLASGLRWAIETLQSAYPDAKIFVASPIQTGKTVGHMSFTDTKLKCDIVKKVAQFTSVYFVDSFSESGFSHMTVPTWTDDGVHPSTLGKPKLVDYVTNEIRKKF